jgi:hypothetical protein
MELLEAHSCQYCQNLVLDFDEEKLDTSLDELHPHQFDPSQRRRITFDFTIRNLRNAATEGCLVCEGYWKALGIASSLPFDSKLTVERIYNTILIGTARMDFEGSLRDRSFQAYDYWQNQLGNYLAPRADKVITSYTTPRPLRTKLSSFPQSFKIVATSGMLKNSPAAAKD